VAGFGAGVGAGVNDAGTLPEDEANGPTEGAAGSTTGGLLSGYAEVEGTLLCCGTKTAGLLLGKTAVLGGARPTGTIPVWVDGLYTFSGTGACAAASTASTQVQHGVYTQVICTAKRPLTLHAGTGDQPGSSHNHSTA
jgi:hypothetical protein